MSSAAPLIPAWSGVPMPVIGMVHLLPLPGSPLYAGDLNAVLSRATEDADALVEGGVHGLIIENFGDAPFYPRRVPAHVVACMSRIAAEIKRRSGVPLGINVLRNDGLSGLAIARAVGADFIRVNVLCGARVTDQGIIEGIAHKLLRYRAVLGADSVGNASRSTAIRILADVNVKHSAPLGPERPVEDEVADTLKRGGADAVVVTGRGTGHPADLDLVRRAKAAAGAAPVLVGSGVTPETVDSYRGLADGLIVGSSLKVDGDARNRVDPRRVQALIRALA